MAGSWLPAMEGSDTREDAVNKQRRTSDRMLHSVNTAQWLAITIYSARSRLASNP